MNTPTLSHDTTIARGPQFPPAYARPWLRFITTPDGGDGGDGDGAGDGDGDGDEGKTFTQQEVDKLVSKARGEERRKAAERFGDYDEVKGKATTLEQRVAEIETELTTTKAAALRTQIAAEYGISTKKGDKGEPSPAEVLLTGADEAAMTAQAKLFAAAAGDSKKRGNVAPKEGGTTTTSTKNSPKDDAKREWLRDLTGNDA